VLAPAIPSNAGGREETERVSESVDDDLCASNRRLVERYLDSVHRLDLAIAAECFDEHVVRIGPRPSWPEPETRGRDTIIEDNRVNLTTLYQPGSVRPEIERVVTDGEYVAVQWVLHAITAKGEPYVNFNHHLFRCRAGRIVAYWTYLDTLHAHRMLFA
jgi:ketosteroid isomerase-like protein